MKQGILISLEIIGWGLLVAGILLTILMTSGVIHSPPELSVSNLIATGILALFVEMRVRFESIRTKFDLVWSDFRHRRKV
ncbi:MAG: hypothetical protein J4473_03610 [Candidatus Aenigmarchaeota archaeon]|nr:hypothetical protein [Candidatus Aenigmarchaeota archaeon]